MPRDPVSYQCSSRFEQAARRQGYTRVAGVDEAGRGCLFGPVVAAAVILDPDRAIRGLNDSKQLTPEQRESLLMEIERRAAAFAVGEASAAEIDALNILQASRLAMKRAVESLDPPADYLLVDAVRVDVPLPQEALIKGDARSRAIAAASIVAKVHRDRLMREWDARYPGYGLARHKGYPTPEHRTALAALGATAEHRRSFLPVQQLELFRAHG